MMKTGFEPSIATWTNRTRQCHHHHARNLKDSLNPNFMASSPSLSCPQRTHVMKLRFLMADLRLKTLAGTRWLVLWILAISLALFTHFNYSPNPFWASPVAQDLKIDPPPPLDDHRAIEHVIPVNRNVDANCDLFDGRWVRDEGGLRYYTNVTCPTIPDSKNCGKYGKDQDFLNWRWKPKACSLPRLDVRDFLQVVRGKRLTFVGDSVARNQMESLLCILSQVESPVDIQKDSDDRFRTWHFPSHDFTIRTLWTRFLIVANERVINGSNSGVFDLHIDKIDTNWTSKLQNVDYIIISDAHWFFRKSYLYERGKLIGCVFCSEDNVTDLGLSFAVRRAFRTSLEHLTRCAECGGTLTILRTFSPSHFEGGSWNGGGGCNRTRPSDEGKVGFGGSDWELRNAQLEEVERVRGGGLKTGFRVLDVTKMMMMRADGHPGTHWDNQWMKGFSDCVHWCMPGAIDVWNEMLLAILKKG